MKNRIRRIFSPTSEEEIKDLNQILGIQKEKIGKCSTCVHYKGSDLPGYWTDYGSCKMKSPSFLERVTHFKVSCSSYQEDIRGVEKIKHRIKELEVLKDAKID